MNNDSTFLNDQLEIKKYFPNKKNCEEKFYRSLLIDTTGRYSISFPDDAELITNIIIKNTINSIPSKDITITDATACVGGNVLSFCNKFMHVNAVEIDDIRFRYLMNNINTYGYKNIDFYHQDYLEIMNDLKQDVIFLDPPWGGKNYKFKNKVKISMSGNSFEAIVMEIIHKKLSKYIVLKLPKNYDFDSFNNCINHNEKVFVNNMHIVVIDVNQYHQ